MMNFIFRYNSSYLDKIKIGIILSIISLLFILTKNLINDNYYNWETIVIGIVCFAMFGLLFSVYKLEKTLQKILKHSEHSIKGNLERRLDELPEKGVLSDLITTTNYNSDITEIFLHELSAWSLRYGKQEKDYRFFVKQGFAGLYKNTINKLEDNFKRHSTTRSKTQTQTQTQNPIINSNLEEATSNLQKQNSLNIDELILIQEEIKYLSDNANKSCDLTLNSEEKIHQCLQILKKIITGHEQINSSIEINENKINLLESSIVSLHKKMHYVEGTIKKCNLLLLNASMYDSHSKIGQSGKARLAIEEINAFSTQALLATLNANASMNDTYNKTKELNKELKEIHNAGKESLLNCNEIKSVMQKIENNCSASNQYTNLMFVTAFIAKNNINTSVFKIKMYQNAIEMKIKYPLTKKTVEEFEHWYDSEQAKYLRQQYPEIKNIDSKQNELYQTALKILSTIRSSNDDSIDKNSELLKELQQMDKSAFYLQSNLDNIYKKLTK